MRSTTKAMLSSAVQAYLDAERVRFLLDRKDEAARLALLALAQDSGWNDEVRAAYAAQTQSILEEYEAKRVKAGLYDDWGS